MDYQQAVLNAISTLAASIDPLMRSGNQQAVDAASKKIAELITKISG